MSPDKVKRRISNPLTTLYARIAVKFPDVCSWREYGLPLKKDKDSRFLVLLVGLMSFLAVLAFSGFFVLSAMTDRWSSGLENKITIEILPETKDGLLRSNEAVKEDAEKIADFLKDSPAIKNFHALSEKEIRELISPWIGDDLTLSDIPLPHLIAAELRSASPAVLEKISADIETVSASAQVNTHHEWLDDLKRLTASLQYVALTIALIIGMTTVTAISGAVRTRMAIHKKEIQLLHLIGATDNYIARQLQRQALILALQGALAGTAAGFLLALVLILFTGNSGTALVPQIALSAGQFLFLFLLPALIAIMAAATARRTVLRELARMP